MQQCCSLRSNAVQKTETIAFRAEPALVQRIAALNAILGGDFPFAFIARRALALGLERLSENPQLIAPHGRELAAND